MSVVAALLEALSEAGDARQARVQFALQLLEVDCREVRVHGAAGGAPAARGSALGRLYARVVELALTPSDDNKVVAATVLSTCLHLGAGTATGFDAYGKQWLSATGAFLAPRCPATVRAMGCQCYHILLQDAHAVGRDTGPGRDVVASLVSMLPSVWRSLEDAASACPALATAAVQALHTALSCAHQSVRPFAAKLTWVCLQGVEHSVPEYAHACRACLALLSYQLPDLPLSAEYGSQIVRSLALLLDLALPAAARVGVDLPPVSGSDAVLALPAISAAAPGVVRRLAALLACVNTLLRPDYATKPDAVASLPLPTLVRLLTSVRPRPWCPPPLVPVVTPHTCRSCAPFVPWT